MTVTDFYTDDENGVRKTRHILETVSSGGEIEVEATMRRKDGEVIWVQVSVSPVFSEAGRLIETQSIVIDITGRKNAENALVQSEKNYRSLLEHTQDGIYLFDPNTLKIVYLNDIGAERLGYTRDELIGKSIELFSKSPGGARGRKKRFAHAIAKNKPAIGKSIHTRKDGSKLLMGMLKVLKY